MRGNTGHEGRADDYGYSEEEAEEFERFTLEPVAPETVREELDEGALAVVDVPEYLGRKLVVECETAVGLYRLIQLFGTPNVPGMEAGREELDRDTTTWQYLFRVSYDHEIDEDAPSEFLLSVYDYKTDVSVGISEWVASDEAGTVHGPIGDAAVHPEVSMPNDDFLETVVQLVLNMVEEPVPASYQDLWV